MICMFLLKLMDAHVHTGSPAPLYKMQLELHRYAKVTITEIPKKKEAMPGWGHGRRDWGMGSMGM